MNTTAIQDLMVRRIRRILLVCNNYDKFALEEDGRIEEQIAQEYLELNLSNPPAIRRAETPEEALELVKNGHHYDTVIAMYNAASSRVFDFAREMKKLMPDSPFVLLTNFSREVYKRIEHEQNKQAVDYYFCWNNQTDLIIAIIKLLEDQLNAEHDILEGEVRAILLVEDSVRYYSTYLPVLYKLLLQQNHAALRDALNEKQQLLRKRARPKILMATCLEEAQQLYDRYQDNIIGVISDIDFVVHKGDDPQTQAVHAGVKLCRHVREINPTMPFLLQSSQEEMREVAKELKVGFVVKTSKTITQELADYIGREFGFGDFIVTHKQTGEIIARASDLAQFENLLKSISAEDFYRYSSNNYMSKWLFARGLFNIGRQVQLHHTTQDNTEEGRQQLVEMIHDYRIHQAFGVVAKYSPESYNDTILFARLGTSSLGGKARGLAFLNHVLQKYDLYDKWEGVRVSVPRTMVITAEYFDRFILDNGLQDVVNSELSDEEILSEFVTSGLPEDLICALRDFVRVTHKPLAIRSSSKLEDSYYQPFAGVYSTYMIPHTDNEDQTMRLLKKAIKSVFASVYMAASKGYIMSSGNIVSEEKMAVVLQEVCGEEQQGYFFPTFSGVARSINFYPVGEEKPEDGIVKVAYGLGKAVVDGDQVLRFCPKYPKKVMQTSTPEHTMRETQQDMFALSLEPGKFRTSVDDAVNLEQLRLTDCEQFASLKKVASTYDYTNQRIVDNCFTQGPRFITFAPILKYNTFPLASIIQSLLDIAQQEMKCPVEIEFAANLEVRPAEFNVLQIRPISADSLSAKVDWSQIDESGAWLSSENALGIGKIDDVRDVIYLRSEAFSVLRTREMADTIREWNSRMRQEERGYLLIGHGRWGSSIPSLGVPVEWSDISEARAIVEAALPDFRVDPSQGSHFFQNLTSFNVGYIHIDPYACPNEHYDVSWLDAQPAVEETELVRHVRLTEPLTIYVDGFKSKAIVK